MSLSFLMPTNAMRVPGISCIGARIYLSKGCSLQVMPDDLLAGGELKPSKVPAVRASLPVRGGGGPSLPFASGRMSWQGEHNRLNTCSPAAASCANAVPVEAATTIPATTNVLIVFLLFRIPIDARPGAGLGSTRNLPLISAQVGSSRLAIAIFTLFEWR